MRVLYVTNAVPWPLTSGYLRHYHFLSGLAARHHEIRVLALGADARGGREELSRFGIDLTSFPRRQGLASRLDKVTRAFPLVATGSTRSLARALDAHRGWADAAVFSGKETFPVLPALGDLPLVIDGCDATSARLREQRLAATGRRRATLRLREAAITRVEAGLGRRGQRLMVASARDREQLGWPRSVVVPNGIDGSYWRRTAPTLGPATIAFTGKLDYPPNEDAALLLIRSVLPLVRAEVPDVRAIVAGRDPTPALRAAAADAGAELTGEVPDLRPYLDRATCLVAPLRFAAGIQNKILEGMAMSLPVVTTPAAAGGLVVDGETPPVTVADDAEGLAAATVKLLREAGPAGEPDHAARDWVVRRFSWEAAAADLDRLLHEAVADASSSPPRRTDN